MLTLSKFRKSNNNDAFELNERQENEQAQTK